MNTRKRLRQCSIVVTKRKRSRCAKKLGESVGCDPSDRTVCFYQASEGEGVGLDDDNCTDSGQSPFDQLPDDLLTSILTKLAASADSPSDFVGALGTCRRFNAAGGDSVILSQASSALFAIGRQQWCDSSHRFFKRCADAGSLEACYSLGMIQFYCLDDRTSGAALMARAAMRSHSLSLYSLAVIQFNGSGRTKMHKDLRAGVALCSRAAFLCNVDALRELGHCFQDGYGIGRNVAEGRRLLVEANARELAIFLSSEAAGKQMGGGESFYSVLSDYGCSMGAAKAHPVNRFLREWWQCEHNREKGRDREMLRLCSNGICGRVETRRHEFRRCSVCGGVNYCSRACQAVDWKARHKGECIPAATYVVDAAGGGFFDVET